MEWLHGDVSLSGSFTDTILTACCRETAAAFSLSMRCDLEPFCHGTTLKGLAQLLWRLYGAQASAQDGLHIHRPL